MVVMPMKVALQQCVYSNPDVFIDTDAFTMTSFGTGDPNKTVTNQDIDTLIWSMSVVHLDVEKVADLVASRNGTNRWPVPVRATECAVYYCVKNIDAEVKGNKITENAAVTAGAKHGADSWKPLWQNLPEYYQPQNIPPADNLTASSFMQITPVSTARTLSLNSPDDSSKSQFRITQAPIKSISAHFQSTFKSADGGCEVAVSR